MLYYLGKEGNAFKKEECKKYKTKDGALKAMAKAEGTCVWDAEGNLINGKLEAETEPEQQTETESEQQSEPEAETESEQQSETESEQQSEPEQQSETESEQQSEPEAEAEPEESTEPKVIIPQGKMKVTVICDGSLNIHRTPEWGESNICGRATRGQTYYVKEINLVDGKKMVRTVGDLYLSGETEFVQFEQL